MNQVPQQQNKSSLTFYTMQCGSLQLNFQADKGVLLFGNTKAGKTTTMHFMKKSQLIGYKEQVAGGNVKYKFSKGFKQVEGAFIGDHESNSETQIPNYCQVKCASENGEMISIVDLPGYSDSFGCFRSVSNRFFIKMVFSRVKNIKFVLVVPFIHLQKTGQSMLASFISFFQMFKNLESFIQQIKQSISLLITGVPQQIDQDTINQIYSRTSENINTNYASLYLAVKKELVSKKRVFMFKQAIIGKTSDMENTLLQDINKRCPKWWQRQYIDAEKKVDTSKIKINAKDCRDDIKFKMQLGLFSEYLENQFKFYFSGSHSFKKIMQQFVRGCQTQQKLSLSKDVQELLKQNEKSINSKQQQYKNLQIKYKNKRMQAQKQMFQKQLSLSQKQNQGVPQKQIPERLQKMRIVRKLYNLAQPIIRNQRERSVQATKLSLDNLKQILKILIYFSKRNPDSMAKIQQFSFMLYKKLQIFTQIFDIFVNTAKEYSDKSNPIQSIKQFQYIHQTFPSELKKVFGFFQQTIYTILQNYLRHLHQNLKRLTYPNPKIYSLYQNFTQEARQMFKEITDKDLNDSGITREGLEGIFKMLEAVKEGLMLKRLEAGFVGGSDKERNFEQFEQVRQGFWGRIQREQDCNSREFQNNLTNNIKLCQMIGHQLKNSNIKLAIKTFQSLNDAHQVLQIYKNLQAQIRLDIKNQQSKIKMLNLLVQYMKKAKKYCRNQLAIEKAQKAFSIAQILGDQRKMEEIGRFLHKICPVSYQDDQDQISDQEKLAEQDKRHYVQMMNLGVYKVRLSDDVSQKIINMRSQKNIDEDNKLKRLSPMKMKSKNSQKNKQ